MEPQAKGERSALESIAWHLALGLATAFSFCFVLLLGWGLSDDPVVVELAAPPDPIIGVWHAGNDLFMTTHSVMVFQRNGRGRACGALVEDLAPEFSYIHQGDRLFLEVSGEPHQYKIEELTETALAFRYGIERRSFERLKGKDLNKALRWLDDPESYPPF